MEAEYNKTEILNFRVNKEMKRNLERIARKYSVNKSFILVQALRDTLKAIK